MAGTEQHVKKKCDLGLQYRASGAQVGIVSCIGNKVLQCNELQWIIGILLHCLNGCVTRFFKYLFHCNILHKNLGGMSHSQGTNVFLSHKVLMQDLLPAVGEHRLRY